MKILFVAVLSIFYVLDGYSQQEEFITVVGDSLIGKLIAGESIREVYGDVVLTQGNVVVNCNKAIQYISSNNAELIGNVIIKQDTLTIFTEKAFYYGNERKAESNSGVKLDDKKVILTADTGEYYFNEDRAFFRHNVKLYDTVTTLTSSELTYFKNENRIIAVGDVKIIDPENIIEADTLEHFREMRITFADKNVSISNNVNNVIIYGDHLEDYARKFYTIVDESPMLIQIDTSFVKRDTTLAVYEKDTTLSIKLDTLIIRSLVMESFRDTLNTFKAKDSVEIVRGEFASKNDFTIYYRDDQKIITNKTTVDSKQPIMWYENSQLTGDSITIFLRDNKIELLEINSNAFILSKEESFANRFNQISGERVLIFFNEEGISRFEVYGGVHSIYYMFEEREANGLTKSSSQSATIGIADNQVNEVRLYGSPTSEYYPENMVEGKEFSYTLPEFIYFENRPKKENLVKIGK